MNKLIVCLSLTLCLIGCSESSPPSSGTSTDQLGANMQGYVELKTALPVTGDTKSAPEVLEFFSYACDHCADFNPQLEKWVQSNPRVHIRKVPVVFGRPNFEAFARLYFALQSLGLTGLDDSVFAAIHQQNKDLSIPDIRRVWALDNKIDAEKLEQAMASSEVEQQVRYGDELSRMAQIEGVPTLVTNGKYSISHDQAGSYENMLTVTDSLLMKP